MWDARRKVKAVKSLQNLFSLRQIFLFSENSRKYNDFFIPFLFYFFFQCSCADANCIRLDRREFVPFSSLYIALHVCTLEKKNILYMCTHTSENRRKKNKINFANSHICKLNGKSWWREKLRDGNCLLDIF